MISQNDQNNMNNFSYHETHDYSEVINIHKIVYPDHDLRKIRWKWENNPSGKPQCFLLRDDQLRKFVGTVSIVPFKAQIHGQHKLFGQLCDGMMLPEYRGRHTYNLLLKYALENINIHFEFLLAFPNSKSLGTTIRMGFKILGDLNSYTIPLSGDYLGNKVPVPRSLRGVISMLASPFIYMYLAFRLPRDTSDVRFETISKETLVADNSWTSLTAYHSVITNRNRPFIKWRFFDAPTTNYQLVSVNINTDNVGYFVLQTNHKSAEIIDFCVGANFQILQDTIVNLIRWCQSKGFESVHFKCSPYNFCVDVLKNCGFIKRKLSSKIIFMPISYTSNTFTIEDFYLTLADSDWI